MTVYITDSYCYISSENKTRTVFTKLFVSACQTVVAECGWTTEINMISRPFISCLGKVHQTRHYFYTFLFHFLVNILTLFLLN